MPRPRFAALDPAKSEAILAAAAQEFAAHGFEAASLNRIIARAGVSKGAIYYYFDDKADLFATVVERAVANAEDSLDGVAHFADAEGFWVALSDLYHRLVAFFASQPAQADLLKSALGADHDPAVAGVIDRELTRMSAATHELLERGVAVGAVRDDLPLDLLTRVVFAMGDASDRWLLERFDELTPAAIARYADDVLALHMRVVAPLSLINAWQARSPS